MISVICIGYRPEFAEEFAVCRHSLRRLWPFPVRMIGLDLTKKTPYHAPFSAGWGEGWCLYVDGCSLALEPMSGLLDALDDSMAGMSRGNVFAVNMQHPANRALTLELIAAGGSLAGMTWLHERHHRKLPPRYAWRDGDDPQISPALICFGTPKANASTFAEQWRHEQALWINGDAYADTIV
jgi:hypothetical protein